MPCPRWRKASLVLRSLVLAAALAVSVCVAVPGARQQPAVVDTAAIGPQVGTAVPPFSGTDQFGVTHTLAVLARRQRAPCSSSSVPGLVTVLQDAARGAAKPVRGHQEAGPWPRRHQLRRARNAEGVHRLARDHVPADLRPGVRHHQALRAAQRDHGPEVEVLRRAASRARSSSIARAWSSSRFFEQAYQERYHHRHHPRARRASTCRPAR